jgi:hypothetical protein
MQHLKEYVSRWWMLLGPVTFWFGGMILMGWSAAALLDWKYDALAGWAAISWPILMIVLGTQLDRSEAGRKVLRVVGTIFSLR